MITEMGYYFTHLVSAITFIKNLDSSCLSIDPNIFQMYMGETTNNQIQSEGKNFFNKKYLSSSCLGTSYLNNSFTHPEEENSFSSIMKPSPSFLSLLEFDYSVDTATELNQEVIKNFSI